MRLGDLDALKEKINAFYDKLFVGCVSSDLITYASGVDGIIDNVPTVVNEYTKGFADGERSGKHLPLTDEEKAILVRQWRPQGEWIDEGQYAEGHSEHAYFCKNCDYHIIEKPNMISENRFCKNCGAEMRGNNK